MPILTFRAGALTRLAALALPLLLTGCDFNPEKFFDALYGRKVNLVVLAAKPMTFSPQTVTLLAQEPMKVIGESTRVCFALKEGVAPQSFDQTERVVAEAMHASVVKVEVFFTDGKSAVLHQPMQAWSKWGKILKHDELSGCAHAPYKKNLPAGAQVSRIEVTATPGFQAQGVYWTSELGATEKAGK